MSNIFLGGHLVPPPPRKSPPLLGPFKRNRPPPPPGASDSPFPSPVQKIKKYPERPPSFLLGPFKRNRPPPPPGASDSPLPLPRAEKIKNIRNVSNTFVSEGKIVTINSRNWSSEMAVVALLELRLYRPALQSHTGKIEFPEIFCCKALWELPANSVVS